MKRFFFSILLLLAGGVSMASAISQPVWQGIFIVNSISAFCGGFPAVGTQYASILRQNRVGAGDEPAALTLIDPIRAADFFIVSDSSQRFRASGSMKRKTFDSRAHSSEDATGYALVTNPAIASWTATTPFLDVTLTIGHFGETGCRVVFKGGFSLVPP
jgi:hypothetical protein